MSGVINLIVSSINSSPQSSQSSQSSNQNSDEDNDQNEQQAVGNKKWYYISKGLASIAVCGMGAFSMYVTNGDTGIGWAIFGLMLIW